MSKIKVLSDKTINQIAAGEVIDRPISVVKELLENSLDAGSSEITVILEQGGKNLIAIHDNGSGIGKEDLLIAVERHATSKLDENKIDYINTLGFRGEALPSIGSISNMRISSKARGADTAYEISVDGGVKSSVKPASRECGTSIEVRNLFAYTPARLKFLKSERSEKAAVLSLLQNFALCYPEVSFKLQYDNSILFETNGGGVLDKELLDSVFSRGFAQNLIPIDMQYEGMKCFGLIGLPTFGQSTMNYQFTFVNKRIVKDKVLNQAIRVAYYNLMAEGKHSTCILFLELDPYEIDVNVHPAKTEIRFRESEKIKSFVMKAIRNTLQAAAPAFATSTQDSVYKRVGNNFSFPNSPKAFTTNNFYERQPFSYSYSQLNRGENYGMRHDKLTPQEEQTSMSIEEVEIPYLGYAKYQVDKTYIVAESKEGLVIVDQHAAHERITLESYKKSINDNKASYHILLVPIVITMPPVELEKLMEFSEHLKTLGFIVERNGAQEVAIRSVPLYFDQDKVHKIIRELAQYLVENDDANIFEKHRDEILGNIACHFSIRAGRALNIDEMNALLRQIESTPFSSQCNHGRPTFVVLKSDDLAKIFNRT